MTVWICKFDGVKDRTLSMWEGWLEGFCGGHEIFQAYTAGP